MEKRAQAIYEVKPALKKERDILADYLIEIGKDDWNEVTLNEIRSYIKHRLMELSLAKKITPARTISFRVHLIQIIELQQGPMSDVQKSAIKQIVNEKGRPLIEKADFILRTAKTFKLRDVQETIEWLWDSPKLTYNAVAVILSITFTTGARVADCLRITRERIREVENPSGRYMIVDIKTSKNNLLGQFKEQLTCKLTENMIVNPWLNIQAFLQIVQKDDLPIFDRPGVKMTTKKVNYVLEMAAKKTETARITAHSGRNTVLKHLYKNNVDDISKIMFMRWRYNTSMHLHYRNNTLEDSEVGAAYQLAEGNYNNAEEPSEE